MTSATPASCSEEILARCFALPELTRTLADSGRGAASADDVPAQRPSSRRFFAPLVDARRNASKSPSAADDDRGVRERGADPRARRGAASFASERFGDNGPARRALEAELVDSSEPLHARSTRSVRASAAREHARRDPRVAPWALSLRNVFEAADRVWVALDAALDAAHTTASRCFPDLPPSMIVGLGIDAVDIERVERMFADKPERMLQRLFGETSSRTSRPSRSPPSTSRCASRQRRRRTRRSRETSSRAASGGATWRCIRDDGSPELRFHGRAAERLAELGAATVHVSLTHSAATAVAVVILER